MTKRRGCEGAPAAEPVAAPAHRERFGLCRPRTDTTLGLLAGGRASRLGGVDKAWLECEGAPLVVRCAQALGDDVDAVLVSANRALPRYEAYALTAVPDRVKYSALGPVAALDALAHACTTTWLVTLPVDVVRVPTGLIATLRRGCGANGAFAVDDDGVQPLAALWRVAPLREVLAAIGPRAVAAHEVHARVGSRGVRLERFTFGNLNTPTDLAAAGIRVAP